jgi:hypothetical protein
MGDEDEDGGRLIDMSLSDAHGGELIALRYNDKNEKYQVKLGDPDTRRRMVT